MIASPNNSSSVPPQVCLPQRDIGRQQGRVAAVNVRIVPVGETPSKNLYQKAKKPADRLGSLPKRLPQPDYASQQVEAAAPVLKAPRKLVSVKSCLNLSLQQPKCQSLFVPIKLQVQIGFNSSCLCSIKIDQRKIIAQGNFGLNMMPLCSQSCQIAPKFNKTCHSHQEWRAKEDTQQELRQKSDPEANFTELNHVTIDSSMQEEERDHHHKPRPTIIPRLFPKARNPLRLGAVLQRRRANSTFIPGPKGDLEALELIEGESVFVDATPNSRKLGAVRGPATFQQSVSETEFLKLKQTSSPKSSVQYPCLKAASSSQYLGWPQHPGTPDFGLKVRATAGSSVRPHNSLEASHSMDKNLQGSSSSLGKVEVSLRNGPSYLFSKPATGILADSSHSPRAENILPRLRPDFRGFFESSL